MVIYLPAQTMADDRGGTRVFCQWGSLYEAVQLIFFDLIALMLRRKDAPVTEEMRHRHETLNSKKESTYDPYDQWMVLTLIQVKTKKFTLAMVQYKLIEDYIAARPGFYDTRPCKAEPSESLSAQISFTDFFAVQQFVAQADSTILPVSTT